MNAIYLVAALPCAACIVAVLYVRIYVGRRVREVVKLVDMLGEELQALKREVEELRHMHRDLSWSIDKQINELLNKREELLPQYIDDQIERRLRRAR